MIEPHGGVLIDLYVDEDRKIALKAASRDMKSWDLTDRQTCDLELITNGALSPLDGFMNEARFTRVRDSMRLETGELFAIPITLEVSESFAESLELGEQVALRDKEGVLLAVLNVDDVWTAREAVCLGGKLEAIQAAHHYDFVALRRTPAEVRADFSQRGVAAVLAFEPDGVIRASEYEQVRRACDALGAQLFVHPVVGTVQPGDLAHFRQVRGYKKVVDDAAQDSLSLLPWVARGDGPTEALMRAIMRKNFGCTHVVTSDLSSAHAEELGLGVVPLKMVRDSSSGGAPDDPPHPRGVTIFLTGLSGSGKSTVANALTMKLLEHSDRAVTLLDGDIVRKHLTKGLGFSKEDRAENIRRIGWVAAEITKHGGITVCAFIAPYTSVRNEVRNRCEAAGGFVEVFVDTPLEECERRDRKGLYKKARAGVIQGFTGVSAPYEAPENPELRFDTRDHGPEAAADLILDHLRSAGYLNT